MLYHDSLLLMSMELTFPSLDSLLCHSPEPGLTVLRRLSLGGIEVFTFRVRKVYLLTCPPKTRGLNIDHKRGNERCTNDWKEFSLELGALGRQRYEMFSLY